MRRSSRLLVAALMLTGSAGLTARPLMSAAAAAVLSSDEIAGFRAKLDGAESGRQSLAKRADCLGGYVADLQARSAERERALGDARRREQELTEQVARFEQEQNGFNDQVRAETENFVSKKRDYDRIQSEYREQASRLNTCSKILFKAICKAGEDAVKKLGMMNDAEAQFRVSETRLQGAQRGVAEAQARLDASRRALSQAQGDFASTQRSIVDLEAQISKAKAANADINVKIQDYNILLGAFADTLKEAGEVDPGDARRRQVDRLSSEVDALASGIPTFAASVDLGLPEDAKARCPR